MAEKTEQKPQKTAEKPASKVDAKPKTAPAPAAPAPYYDGFDAEIVEVIGRTGVFGEVKQVMAKVLQGRDQGNVIRRNIKGPVKVGDIIVLLETERESKALKTKKRAV
jgi:small subunit ribosomal protein S28e